MGILRFAGASLSPKRQSESGSKTLGMHVSQQVNIDVCYAVVVWFSVVQISSD